MAKAVAAKQPSFAETLRSFQKAEIKGFLCQGYVIAESPYLQLATGIGKSKRLEIDGGDFMQSKEWMVDTRKEVETTPNELEVFKEVRETRLLAKHEAGKDPYGDPAGTDVALHGMEAATSIQVRLGRTSEIHETLTRVGVGAEEQTGLMFHPDNVSQLIASTEGSNLISIKPDDHLDKYGAGSVAKEVEWRG